MNKTKPDLSVIIPTLNEFLSLPMLLQNLTAQKGLRLEIIVVDGGSTDGTAEIDADLQKNNTISFLKILTKSGRGHQQNCGAQASTSEELLFLHADTTLDDDNLLANALVQLQAARKNLQGQCVAGHFSVRFIHRESGHDKGYYFFECKTHLNRTECINGDQGIMLSKSDFESIGRFDESLNFMEDARLAQKISTRGQWISLIGHINTSARRFESEGLKERQTLNAFLRNFNAIGFLDFFYSAKEIYRTQDNTGRLQLKPFLLSIHKQFRSKGFIISVGLWYKTGSYVADNAWQIAYALDCNRNFAQQFPPNHGPTPWLNLYDKFIAPLLTSPPGYFLTAAATFTWFYSRLIISLIRS